MMKEHPTPFSSSSPEPVQVTSPQSSIKACINGFLALLLLVLIAIIGGALLYLLLDQMYEQWIAAPDVWCEKHQRGICVEGRDKPICVFYESDTFYLCWTQHKYDQANIRKYRLPDEYRLPNASYQDEPLKLYLNITK